MMNKKVLLLIVFIVFSVGIGVVASMIKPKPSAVPIPPAVRVAAPPPTTVFVENAPKNPTFQFEGKELETPTTLPIYEYKNKQYTNNEISQIAASLGFSTTPLVVSSGEKAKTLWTTPEKALSFYTNTIDQTGLYTLFKSSVTTKPTSLPLIAIKNFISTNLFLSDLPSLLFEKESAGPFDGIRIDDVSKPTLSGFYFSYAIDDKYPIASNLFNTAQIVCVVDQYGVVRLLSFSPPPTIKSVSAPPLLTSKEAFENLKLQRGILIQAEQTPTEMTINTPSPFSSVVLSDVRLVYYMDTNKGLLVPYYIFSGVSKSASTVQQTIRYAVAAVEQY